MKNKHIVFFDDECPFCHAAVRRIIEIDSDERLFFAPLRGITARDILTGPQQPLLKANSLVFVENYRSTERNFWTRSHAILRIYWCVGNGWSLLGIFSFMPRWLGDFFYDWFAAHRHQFKLKIPDAPAPRNRFLP